jgi:hypothetical protein
MYDPVLNRPMFQAQNTSAPVAPMGAKGTGITSMVTSPDPDTAAQQLKAFANPAMPTVGYADGGPVQHFQEGGIASMWDNFVNSLSVKGETQSPFQGPTPMRKENYQRPGLPDIGLRIGQQNDYRRDAGITGGGANYVEPIDVGGENAEPRVPNVDAERRELGQSVDRLFNPTPEELAGQQAKMDEQRNKLLASGVSPEDVSRMLPRPTPARPPSVQNFENPYRNDNTSDRFEREQIERMKGPPAPPPVPQERPPAEERSSISTELNKIREDRKAQSAADRRENALMALMSAGFGMAAGKSRHALTNIAEGGQQGIGTFAQLEKGRREDENRRYLSALHEKEVALRERELAAREPLIAAQTKAQESIPAYREQLIENKKFTANANAQARVETAMKNLLNNPTDPRAQEVLADKTGVKKQILAKQLHDKFFIEELRKPTESSQSDPYGIRSLDKSTGGE